MSAALPLREFSKSVDAPISMLLVLLVFQNLLNPFSPFLTLSLNIVVASHFLLRKNIPAPAFDAYVLSAVLFILVWFLLVVSVRGGADTQVALKYFRITIAIGLFAIISVCAGQSVRSIIFGLNLALGFHVSLVIAQLAIPDLTYITAPIFGFERESTILEGYALRKLGASSSYDTASLLSVAGLLLYYLQFQEGRGSKFAWWAAVAFTATLFSSRTGMVFAVLIVAWIAVVTIIRAAPAAKLAASSLLLGLGAAGYLLLLPLALHSLGIAELQSDEVNLVFAAADYGTTGTLEALTADHLEPLNQPLGDLFLGYAIDPNSIHRYTDIGYVKLIYHVGIPGTAAIVLIHLYMLFRGWKIARSEQNDQLVRLVARLLCLLLLLGIAFNYKSLDLYSRGFGDTLFLLFFLVHAWSTGAKPMGESRK